MIYTIALILMAINMVASMQSCAHRYLEEPPPPEEGYMRSTCSSGLAAAINGYWVNKNCEDDYSYYIFNNTYYPEDGEEEGSEWEKDGTSINLSNVLGETIELKHKNTGNTHIVGQWVLKTDVTKTITFTLTRDDENSEEIGLQYTSGSSVTRLANKNLTSGGSNGITLELNNTSEIIVTTMTLRPQPRYDILIEQQGLDLGTPNVLTNNKKLVQIVAVALVIIFAILILSCITFALGKRSGNKWIRFKRHFRRLARRNEADVEEVMSNMAFGNYRMIGRNLRADSCTICKNSFKPNDQGHLTNECLHLFHSDCLKKWYQIISNMSDMTGPEGNALTHSYSEKNSNINEIEAKSEVENSRCRAYQLEDGDIGNLSH